MVKASAHSNITKVLRLEICNQNPALLCFTLMRRPSFTKTTSCCAEENLKLEIDHTVMSKLTAIGHKSSRLIKLSTSFIAVSGAAPSWPLERIQV